MNKVQIFRSFLCLFALQFVGNQWCLAELLDVERAVTDSVYRESIQERFLKTNELQVGGTHLSGNRTVIKVRGVPTNTLDPGILNINPSNKAHALDSQVLSIQGDGFDLELLKKLRELCLLFDHQFKRVFINNIEIALSVPAAWDQHRVVAYAEENSGVVHIPRCTEHFNSVYEYIRRVLAGQEENLYSLYFDLLSTDGRFLLKTGEQRKADLVTQGFFTNLNLSGDDTEAWVQEFREIERRLSVLRKVGDKVDLNWIRTDFEEEPVQITPYYKLQMQVLLLRNAGFSVPEVSVRRFKSWGYFDVSDVFAMVMIAKKQDSKEAPKLPH